MSRFSTEFARKIAVPAPLLAYVGFLGLFGLLGLLWLLAGLPLADFFHDSAQLLIGMTQTMTTFAIVGIFFTIAAGFLCWCLSLAHLREPVTILLSLAFRLANRAASFWRAEPDNAAATPSPPPRDGPLVSSASRVTLLTPSALTGAAPLLE